MFGFFKSPISCIFRLHCLFGWGENTWQKQSNILILLRLKLNKRSTESSELNGEVKEDKGGGVEQMAWLEWHLALCLISGERYAVIVDRGGDWRPGVLFLVFNPMLFSSFPSYLSPSLPSLALYLSLPSQRVCLTLFITWPHMHGHNKAPGVDQDTSVAHAFVCAFSIHIQTLDLSFPLFIQWPLLKSYSLWPSLKHTASALQG